MLSRLGAVIARRPWWVLAAWALVVAGCALPALGVVGEGLFARLTSGPATVPGEAREGADLLEAEDPRGPSVLLQLALPPGEDAASAGVQQALGSVMADLGRADGVASVAAPLQAPAGAAPEVVAAAQVGAAVLTSEDGRSVLVTAELEPDLPAAREQSLLASTDERLAAVADDLPGSTARVASLAGIADEVSEQVERDLRTGEAVALPISLAVMVVVFGGFLAAGIPLLGAVVSIAGGLGALLGFSHLIDVDASIVNVVTVLGLGLCIDYGLLVVSRYREELRAVAARRPAGGPLRRPGRAERDEALVLTLASAGRTVVFSAVTIGISLAGLLVFSAGILRAMGAAAASVVVVALLVALTLVPALLAVGGARLTRPGALTRVPVLRVLARRLGDVAPEEGAFSRLARAVQRRPWAVLVGVVAVLLVTASPVLGLQLRSDGISLLPVTNPSRAFFDDLDERFPGASSPAVTVVADAELAEVEEYAAELAERPGTTVDPPRQAGGVVALGVRVDAAGTDDEAGATRELLADLAEEDPGFPTWATGQAADTRDFRGDLLTRAPIAVGLVVLATFTLLFLMTGSVLVPLKALVANALSLGACLGVLVWVFQEGHLEGVLGFTSTGGVETFVPPLALAFGFGLAMDYEVFLLARILDARRSGLPSDEAVVQGLQRSGRIITSAALIIVIVFSGFVSGQLLAIKEVGLALAVAVAIDASLVRMLLVPATMTVLGEWNWWAPRPLRRLHDRFGISEGPAPAAGPEPDAHAALAAGLRVRGRHRA